MQQFTLYEVLFDLYASVLIDEWGNFNTVITDSLVGSIQTGFWKISTENDKESSNSSFTVSKLATNPTFNQTELTVNIFEAGSLNIVIYDLAGSQIMEVLTNQFVEANSELTVPMTLKNLASGIYTVMVSIGNDKIMKQIIIVK